MSRKALAAHVHEKTATVGWREREREILPKVSVQETQINLV